MSVSSSTPSFLSRTGGRVLIAALLVVIATLATVVGLLAAGSGRSAAPAPVPVAHSVHVTTTDNCALPRLGRPVPC